MVADGHTERMSLRMYTEYPAGGTTERMRVLTEEAQPGDEQHSEYEEGTRGYNNSSGVLLSLFRRGDGGFGLRVPIFILQPRGVYDSILSGTIP